MKGFKAYITEGSEPKSPCRAKSGDKLNLGTEAQKWFRSGGASGKQSQGLVDAFKELIACKGEFPNELSPGNSPIYRGISVRADQLKRWIGKQKDFTMGEKGFATTKASFVYKPSAPVESWTTNFSVARMFSHATFTMYTEGQENNLWNKIDKKTSALKAAIKVLLQKMKAFESNPEEDAARKEFYKAFDDIDSLLQTLSLDLKREERSRYGVMFMMTPDEGCVMNPAFSNRFGHDEDEVVRVDVGQTTKAQLLFPEGYAKRNSLIKEIKELLAMIPDFSSKQHKNRAIFVELLNSKTFFLNAKQYLEGIE
jgi:hypothetical protein